jgi:hypothetical protein
MVALAYDASTNTAFLGKSNLITQINIPTLVNTDDYAQLNSATIAQSFTTYVDKLPIADDTDGMINNKIGWMKLIGGKLYFSGYQYYDGPGNENVANIAVIDNPYDLANSTYGGWVRTGTGDWGASYVMEIPSDKRATFGNYTHLTGTNAHLAIVSRSSLGHSLIGVNIGDITIESTVVNSTAYVRYPVNNPVEGYSNYNEDVVAHYEAIALPQETTWEQWLDIDPSQRLNDFSALPSPDNSLQKNLITFGGWFPFGFIPEGTNSVVYLGYNVGMRYGSVYKCRDLEWSAGKSGGPAPISGTDKHNMMWTMNISDIASAQNVYEPKYNYVDIFQNERWLQKDPSKNNAVVGGLIVAADYDSTSKRLYVMQQGMPDPNPHNTGHVVSVYQVS